ncbi:MAG TPA: thiamine phosphate synthase [Opitutaceae bacterium]|nr:thiamine phosphate synthase [Opitutaceae bacterium]
MQIAVISPESTDPRELPAMEGFLAAGLWRYHVRKPSWTERELEAWLRALPVAWRPRLVLHQHHALVATLGLGGRHEKGDSQRAEGESRSCHDLPRLRRYLRSFGQVLFGPVFPSLTKPGYGPAADFPWRELQRILKERDDRGSARVLAIGGVTAERLGRCGELGFDGAAVMGAVWNGPDPVRAFAGILGASEKLGATCHAA